MSSRHRRVTLMLFGWVVILSGCWNSQQTQESVTFPYTDLAIDSTSCSCTANTSATDPTPVTGACEVFKNNPNLQLLSCGTVYAATDGGGIYKSSNGGDAWNYSSAGVTDLYVKTLAVDLHPSAVAPREVFVGTEDGGIFRSVDGGVNWIRQAESSPILSVSKIVMDTNSCTGNPPCLEIYAASRGDGVWKSNDGGQNWTKVTTNGLIEPGVSSLVLSPAGIFPTKVYAGTEGMDEQGRANGHVFKYEPASLNPLNPSLGQWTESGTATTPLPEEVISLAVQPNAQQIIYAGLSGGEGGTGAGGVYRSLNDGLSWDKVNIFTPRSDSVFELAFTDPTTGPKSFLYASVYGLSRCSYVDTGCTATTDWESIDVGRDKGVSALAIDPYTHTTLYVGTFKGELFKSTDSGVTWNRLSVGF